MLPELPITAALGELSAALESGARVILSAEPGAGKTTLVPLSLLDAAWRGDGRIVLMSPRRVAARLAAARMAALLGERVGERVGFRVRMESAVSARTRIEVVTQGVFTRMILDDPALEGVAAVVFDEFHERSLESDLGLALALDAQGGLREDLRLLVMSATLDVGRTAELLGGAQVVSAPGRAFPVEIRHSPPRPGERLEATIARCVRAALASHDGSLLVFLPGVAEIQRCLRQLDEAGGLGHVDVLPLYGALSAAQQDEALRAPPQGRRSVILSTAIAESSVTIDHVRVVIDAGLSRRARFEPGLGLSRLDTVRASQAAIAQRAGRAGRVAPGVCYRLWGEGETRALPAFDRPEILDADLSALALTLAAWGVRDAGVLRWIDAPPEPALREGLAMLQRLGAIDGDGAITAHGRSLAQQPLEPRLAHMLISAEPCDRSLAARLAILLSEAGLGGRGADLRGRLRTMDDERSARAGAARRLAKRLAGGASDAVDEERAGIVLAAAFPDRIAKARGGGRCEFLMANGRAAAMDEADPLAREKFLVIADATGAAGRTRILSAAPLEEADVEALFTAAIGTRTIAAFDAQSGTVRARRVRRLGAITLREETLARVTPEVAAAALAQAIREFGLSVLPWDDGAIQLRARMAFLRERDVADDWPDWSEASLIDTLETWAPLHGAYALRDLEGKLGTGLAGLLSFEQKRRAEKLAPTRFISPAGIEHSIDYCADGGPRVEVRLQEMFGLDVHPAILDGRAPLTLALTSPADRPVQTTRDLPGFWRGSYASVRADMRGRYPKHPWPEDPLKAEPTRRAKPRGG